MAIRVDHWGCSKLTYFVITVGTFFNNQLVHGTGKRKRPTICYNQLVHRTGVVADHTITVPFKVYCNIFCCLGTACGKILLFQRAFLSCYFQIKLLIITFITDMMTDEGIPIVL